MKIEILKSGNYETLTTPIRWILRRKMKEQTESVACVAQYENGSKLIDQKSQFASLVLE